MWSRAPGNQLVGPSTKWSTNPKHHGESKSEPPRHSDVVPQSAQEEIRSLRAMVEQMRESTMVPDGKLVKNNGRKVRGNKMRKGKGNGRDAIVL